MMGFVWRPDRDMCAEGGGTGKRVEASGGRKIEVDAFVQGIACVA